MIFVGNSFTELLFLRKTSHCHLDNVSCLKAKIRFEGTNMDFGAHIDEENTCF
jgi:hypothetical protein